MALVRYHRSATPVTYLNQHNLYADSTTYLSPSMHPGLERLHEAWDLTNAKSRNALRDAEQNKKYAQSACSLSFRCKAFREMLRSTTLKSYLLIIS